MTFDIQLLHLLNNLAGRSAATDAVIVFLARDLAYILIAIFLLLLYFSKSPKQEKLRALFLTFVSSAIARFGITELIRFFYNRPRPFVVLPVHQLLTENSWSFPSGHATFFFAMATAIYFYNKKWGIGFFIAAIFMTIGRVIAGVHYPSDIIGGAFIGIAVAYATFYLVRGLDKGLDKSDLSKPDLSKPRQ